MSKFLKVVALCCLSPFGFAGQSQAVNSHTCSLVAGSDKPFVLVLEKGEQVMPSISRCASDAKLKGAALLGLGAVDQVTLNYFDHKLKQYHQGHYPNFSEVLALNGNIAQIHDAYKLHIHTVLSDDHFHVYGGHLSRAQVAATLEITITPFSFVLEKKHDATIGLDLIETPAAVK